jgi:hypothetical protein
MAHPYTRACSAPGRNLVHRSAPGGQRARLAAIPGNVPELVDTARWLPVCRTLLRGDATPHGPWMPADTRPARMGADARCALLESAG